MNAERLYTQDEVAMIAQQAVIAIMNLDNTTSIYANNHEEGDNSMANRVRKRVMVNGKLHWVTGATDQECMQAYLSLCMQEGLVAPPIAKTRQNGSDVPLLKDYLPTFFDVFKNKQRTITKLNRDRIAKNHILPKFGEWPLNKITTMELQKWFDELANSYSHETILKIKNILNPALDAAVEDGYIQRNPLNSSRIHIGGAQTVHHKAIPADTMRYIRSNIWCLQLRQKRMLALLSYTGMRFEEVLGLKWQDIDFINDRIHICRAVVHPDRNKPEVAPTKTAGSNRTIPMAEKLKKLLLPYGKGGYVLPSASDKSLQTPLSYTQARNTFKRIRSKLDIHDYTAHDFRDTCATEWRQSGIPTDIIAKLLGHTKSEITQKRYVKYRDELLDGAKAVIDTISEA